MTGAEPAYAGVALIKYASRIAVRFQYESHDTAGQWWRSFGNELWEFDEHGPMRRREASVNDLAITEAERRIFGPRPASERGQEFPSDSDRRARHH
jgi:uncharacterized protein